MEFLGYVFDLTLQYYFVLFMMSYIAYTLAGRRMPFRKVLLLQIPMALIMGTLYMTVIYIYQANPEFLNFNYYRVSYGIIEIGLEVLWIFVLFRDTDKKKRFFYASAVYNFTFVSSSIMLMLQSVVIIEDSMPRQGVYRVAVSLLVIGVTVIAARLASKTKFWSKLQAFGDYPKMFIPMGTVYFIVHTIATALEPTIVPVQWTVFAVTLVYIVLFVIVVLMVSGIKRTESLNAARNLLLQQQSYINKLESVQREIRSIQHDYKNMLSGLYAQASEGNAEAVKEYIDTKLLKADETVRENLSQINQLEQIKLPELKGLILTKMLGAEREQVDFRLEVMFPVSRVSMETGDMLRCVGILLDNALEEARKQEKAAVTLLLLQEDKTLTVVVKNPLQDKPEMALIWNEGYSTKGSGRGIGLSNYQSIVRRYPNATQETKIEGEYFVQVLVLEGN